MMVTVAGLVSTPLRIGWTTVRNRLYRAPVLEGAGDGPDAAEVYARHFVANARHGVVLPYNYWPERRWREAFDRLGLAIDHWDADLGLYPWPFSLVFERRLHFVTRLRHGPAEAGGRSLGRAAAPTDGSRHDPRNPAGPARPGWRRVATLTEGSRA